MSFSSAPIHHRFLPQSSFHGASKWKMVLAPRSAGALPSSTVRVTLTSLQNCKISIESASSNASHVHKCHHPHLPTPHSHQPLGSFDERPSPDQVNALFKVGKLHNLLVHAINSRHRPHHLQSRTVRSSVRTRRTNGKGTRYWRRNGCPQRTRNRKIHTTGTPSPKKSVGITQMTQTQTRSDVPHIKPA